MWKGISQNSKNELQMDNFNICRFYFYFKNIWNEEIRTSLNLSNVSIYILTSWTSIERYCRIATNFQGIVGQLTFFFPSLSLNFSVKNQLPQSPHPPITTQHCWPFIFILFNSLHFLLLTYQRVLKPFFFHYQSHQYLAS